MKTIYAINRATSCILLALFAATTLAIEPEAVHFGGGHPWLSRNRLVYAEESLAKDEGVSGNEENTFSSGERGKRVIERPIPAGRIFDLTVSMYKHRTAEERKQIEEIFKYFAWAVYEATETKHKIGVVRIYEHTGICGDIVWNEEGAVPMTSEMTHVIYMYDKADGWFDPNYMKSPDKGGFTLAHEWGHSAYRFGEEYRDDFSRGFASDNDDPVVPSLMNQQNYAAKDGDIDAEWLNLSIAADSSKGSNKKYRNTKNTDQHRKFGQSCLQQLVTPKPVSPRPHGFGFKRKLKYVPQTIPYYPEFAKIDPTKEPGIDLTEEGKKAATNELKVVWADDPKPMSGICIDHSTSMSASDLDGAKANAKRIIDMAPVGTLVGVFAFGSGVETIFNYTEVTDANRSSLKTKIDSISSSGNTALWKAADVALNAMNTLDPEHNNIGSLLLLTDGGDNASGSITKASVVSKCLEMGVAFNSISYGGAADANLVAASSETGGRNVSASASLSSLNDAFSRLFTYGSLRLPVCDEKGATSSSGTWTKTFDVDSSIADMQTTITLSVPSSSATVCLVSPTGTRYAATSTMTVGGESTFVFPRTNPAAGRWTVSVTAPSGTRTSCYVDASANKEPPRLSLRVDEEDETIYAFLDSGAPVDGASVRALIQENGTTREVPFAAIGAGTYKLSLQNCGNVSNGLTVRADATKGVATHTYVGVMDYAGDGEGAPIAEGFTRSEWLDISYVAPATRWYYSVSNGCATITGAYPTSGDLDVPTTLGGYPVTAIGERAFMTFYGESSDLTSITIPNGVARIEDGAFYNCHNLRSVTIPSSVRTIGRGAFHYCSSLTSIDISYGLEDIQDYAFCFCSSLMSITIPGSVTNIEDNVFGCCGKLTKIEVDPNNEFYRSINDVLFSFDGKQLIACPGGKTGGYSIPNGVTTIGSGAFGQCAGLTTIQIPNSVTSIGDNAFASCTGLSTIEIPNGVTSIDYSAFYNCTGLTSIQIPNSVTSIGSNAFGACSGLKNLSLPERFRGKTANMGIPSGCKVVFSSSGTTTFTVEFAANGGTGTMAAQEMTYGKAAKLKANKFTRKGWIFLGWSKTKKGPVAYKNGATVKNLAAAGKSVTLYAQWAKKNYKVRFVANGGKGKMAVQKMTYGKKAKLKANKFKRKGYVFKGWAKTKALANKGKVAYKNKKSVKDLVENGKTVKLYAVWKKK